LQEGTKGSFASEVMDSKELKGAYKKAKEAEKEMLKKYTELLNKGKIPRELAMSSSFYSGLAKSMGLRYASRKTLFKLGYDKNLSQLYYLGFTKDGAKQADDNA
jgi:hypothetical protein